MKYNIDKNSICFVIPNYVTFATGGAEIQVHYLTQEFLKRGWSVEVVCAGIGYEKQIEESQFYDKRIKYYYYKKLKIRSFEYFSVLKLLKKTKSKYYYQRTDFALTASTYFFTKHYNRTMIYALASDDDAVCDKYVKENKKFSNYSNIFKKVLRKTDLFMIDKMVEYAKGRVNNVVCQNEEQVKLFHKSFNNKNTVLINNSFMAPKNEAVPEKEKVILWVGNNVNVKRPDIFVDLAQHFFNEKSDYTFVMIGKGCEGVDTKNIPSNLKVLGSLGYKETNNWFAKASIFVNTSSIEGMPNTFIQAWHYKTIIASLNVNPSSILTKNKLGIFADSNIDELKKQIDLAIKKPDYFNEYIINSQDYLNEFFNISKNVDRLIEKTISKNI